MVENMKGETVGSWKLMEKCLDLDLCAAHKWVLIVLCSHYPNIFPSEADIAEDAGISQATVRRAIAYLEKEKWIAVHPRKGTSNLYTVDVARIKATPPRKLTTPTVEGGLPFPTPAQGEQPPTEGVAHGEQGTPLTVSRGVAHGDPLTYNSTDKVNKQVITDNMGVAQGEQARDEVPCLQEKDMPGSPSAGALSEPVIAGDDRDYLACSSPHSPALPHRRRELKGNLIAPESENEVEKEGSETTNKDGTPTIVDLGATEQGIPIYGVDMSELHEYACKSPPPPVPRRATPAYGPPSPFNDSELPAVAPPKSAKAEVLRAHSEVIPADWKVVQVSPKWWSVLKSYDGGKSSIPIGSGPTKEAAIAEAHSSTRREAAKWKQGV
jgi:hypothetical protein